MFFVYWDELPENVGFSIFGPAHILWLAILTAGIAIITIWYYRLRETGRRRVKRFIGWFLVGEIIVRMIYLLVIGKQTVYELPLHLCSLAGFLCLLHSYKSVEWLNQSLYALCLPGAIFALLFSDWTIYPAIHFISIEGFSFHAGIVLYVICMLVTGQIVPCLKKIWKAFLFLGIAAGAVFVFDKIFDTNYMFLNWPPEKSPLEWLASFMGNPGYLIGYAVLVFLIPCVMVLAYERIRKWRE